MLPFSLALTINAQKENSIVESILSVDGYFKLIMSVRICFIKYPPTITFLILTTSMIVHNGTQIAYS